MPPTCLLPSAPSLDASLRDALAALAAEATVLR